MAGGRPVRIRASAGVLIRYKSQFGTDYNEDKELADKLKNEDKAAAAAGRLLWAMARTADENVMPFDDWICSIGSVELQAALIISQDMFAESVGSIREHKKGRERFTAERFLACASACGFTLSELDELPMHMVLDTIDEFMKISGKDISTDGCIVADQAAYDSF